MEKAIDTATGNEGWLRKRVLGRALATLMGLCLVEGGHRGVLAFLGRSHDAVFTRGTIDDFVTQGDDEESLNSRTWWRGVKYQLHPYVGFVPEGHVDFTSKLQAFNWGDPGVATVLVFGGSVALGVFNQGHDVFERAMRERFEGRRVKVFICAHAEHKQPQQLMQLAFLLATGVRPGLVINLDGFNEVAVAGSNVAVGVHPAYPSFARYAHLAVAASRERESAELAAKIRFGQQRLANSARRARLGQVHRSSVLSALVLPGLERKATAVAANFESYAELNQRSELRGGSGRSMEQYNKDRVSIRGPQPRNGYPDPVSEVVKVWRSSSVAMHALSQAYGFHYLHVLQPTLHDKGSKLLTADERRSGKASPEWVHYTGEGNPRLREAGKELADRGLHFHDASGVFRSVEESLYFDPCHFVKKGCLLVVDDMIAALEGVWPPTEIAAGKGHERR